MAAATWRDVRVLCDDTVKTSVAYLLVWSHIVFVYTTPVSRKPNIFILVAILPAHLCSFGSAIGPRVALAWAVPTVGTEQ
jgi:hypothetical protein